jgi:hypothetical protein
MTIDGEDLELFERSLRSAVERDDVDAAVAELGWQDALTVDRRAAVSLLFALQGRAGATSSVLDAVVLDALGVEEPVGVVHPALGSWAPPAGGCGLGTRALPGSERALVVTGDGTAVLVPTSALSLRDVDGMDPRLGLVEVTAVPSGGDAVPVGHWGATVAVAQLAVSAELLGASRRMLELAREHALEREQFGQVIARFQAIRHRLAEAFVAIETAEAVVDAAWLDGTPETAAMAKSLAGRGARTVVRHCQQVLAGIGFTTEHDLQLFIKRTFVLDELYGSSRALTRALGEDVLATRRLPATLPL